MNFKDYKTSARYAEQINAGYSDRLNGAHVFDVDGWLDTPEGLAYTHGYEMADRHELSLVTNRSEK